MKIQNFLMAAFLSGGLLVGCNNAENTDGEMNEGEVVQTHENLDMEEEKAPQARHIEVVAENMEYKPNELRAAPGEMLHVTLINNGQEEHNIEFELPEGEQELPSPVQPGNRASLSFTAPQQPGTYTIYCPVENHREKGMTGTLIVE